MPESGRLWVDRNFVSRLLLGALSEHEQRLLVTRLLPHDAQLRQQILALVGPFQSFDGDLMERFSASLTEDSDATEVRRELIDLSRARAPDLEKLLRDFTFGDALRLGPATQRIFSWTTAELLLSRSSKHPAGDPRQETDLYLALMVIDVLDILGASGERGHFPQVIEDVRQRIERASAKP